MARIELPPFHSKQKRQASRFDRDLFSCTIDGSARSITCQNSSIVVSYRFKVTT